MFLSLPTIGSIAFNPSALLASYPTIKYEVLGHVLGNVLYGFIKRNRKRRGLTRAQMRKVTNRRRRQFVDNIIMHHRRLAEMNREVIANNARERALLRREKILKKNDLQKSPDKERDQERRRRWQGGVNLRDRGQKMRGTIDAMRTRARSRWLTIANEVSLA